MLADMIAVGFRYQSGVLSLLDQQQLPRTEAWVECSDLDIMVDAILALKVRGAPAIGVSACLFLASMIERGEDNGNVLLAASSALRAARPTAVNLNNYLDTVDPLLALADTAGSDWRNRACNELERIFTEDIALCEAIASNGQAVIGQKSNVLTHCNTGGLATAGRGTALGIITLAHEAGKQIHVWVDETRPLLQGGRLTSWELGKHNIPHAVICDSAAALLMQQNKVDVVITGADRIARNGDSANKIGTYSLAVLAKHHGVPFYIAAPRTTLDLQCASGADIPIEQRSAAEVRGVSLVEESIEWVPGDSPVYNPAFDVTPAALISGWILDDKLHTQAPQ